MAETVLIDAPFGPVRASFSHPARKSDARVPVVLIGPRLPGDLLEREGLEEDLAASLHHTGFAVLACEGGDTVPPRAADVVDQASAAFRWLLLREDIDPERVALFASGSACIPVACLAARSDRIVALCLFAPMTATEIIARSARPDGKPPLLERALVPDEFIESLSEVTPVDDLAVEDRPTLILHGAADRSIAPEVSYTFFEPLARDGRSARYELIAHAGHELEDDDLRQATVERVVSFFLNVVRSRQKSTQVA